MNSFLTKIFKPHILSIGLSGCFKPSIFSKSPGTNIRFIRYYDIEFYVFNKSWGCNKYTVYHDRGTFICSELCNSAGHSPYGTEPELVAADIFHIINAEFAGNINKRPVTIVLNNKRSFKWFVGV